MSRNHFSSLEEGIHAIFGSDRQIAGRQPVYGGDINDAYALILDDGRAVFMKSNTRRALDNFEAEADGLRAIADTGAIGTPQILGCGTDPAGFSFLLLSFIHEGRKIRGFWEEFARQLAAMHRAPCPAGTRFGLDRDNYIGHRAQKNTWHDTWISFFRDCRLAGQLQDAGRYFDAADRKRAAYLLDHLDRYLLEPAHPSLIHGDLWGGNYMTGEDGKAWLIDPAVCWGHPEADLAMTELFGGFAPDFYDAYRECMKLEPGYADRRDLYNLYHLLNHLNMFGGGYLASVRGILKRYAG